VSNNGESDCNHNVCVLVLPLLAVLFMIIPYQLCVFCATPQGLAMLIVILAATFVHTGSLPAPELNGCYACKQSSCLGRLCKCWVASYGNR
jgi:hypothetical protein